MTKNDDPEQARIAQDLDVPPQRLSEGPVHTGRGGAANVQGLSAEEAEANRSHNVQLVNRPYESNASLGVKGWADRGKDFLFGIGKRNK